MNKVFILFLVVVFLKEIVFSAIVPIWHTPDEQAHFAEVAYYSEKGVYPLSGNDLNKEIYVSENLLGTLRDKNGDNRFTFHPGYKIEYTNTLIGKYEGQISQLPRGYRTEFVKQEAAGYPPLYYSISSVFYKIFYNFDLFVRVYSVRFVSIVLGVLLAYLAFLIGKEIFPDSELLQISLPILVSFQPMISFVSSGVNSDNLMNVLFTILIYFSVLIIKQGVKLSLILAVTLDLFLLYLTKPQFIYGIPMFLVAIIFSFKKGKNIIFSLLGTIVLGIVFMIFEKDLTPLIRSVTYLYSFNPGDKAVTSLSIGQYIKNTLIHTYAEVLPWYWGVFDWLGVTLPRLASRTINLFTVVATAGVLIGFWKMIKRRVLNNNDKLIIYMFLSVLIYFAAISYYDYLFILSHGFSFGIQGRYFFPTIVPEMFLLLWGFNSLIPKKYLMWRNNFIKIVVSLMLILNFVALWTISQTYYNMSNFGIFMTQISQYKPGIFKGVLFVIWLVLYLVILGIFMFKFYQMILVKQGGKRSGKI